MTLRESAPVRGSAATSPGSPDPLLRGRTYAIPFEEVWRAATELADGGIPGWSLVRSDDAEGIIEAEVTARILPLLGDVEVRVSLDADAQTRVDVYSSSRAGKMDLGAHRRRIGRFLVRLDESLDHHLHAR